MGWTQSSVALPIGSNQLRTLTAEVVDVVAADFPVGFSTTSENERLLVAYYNPDHDLTVACRESEGATWHRKVLSTRANWDSHRSIVLAVDRRGHVHVSGNMHADPMVYFRTSEPYDIETFEPVKPLVNEAEEQRCTYPRFLEDAEGDLVYLYRLGGSGNGVTIVNRYRADSGAFERVSDRPLFDGLGEMNAYQSGPARGPDGKYHVVWVWRDTPHCETNHDLSYAVSEDLTHWHSIVSIEAGLSPSIIAHDDPNVVTGIGLDGKDWTFTPTFARIDEDLYPELLMVADFNHTQLFMNNRDGTFTNVTDPEVLIDGNGMGSAVGDYDNDGDLDWFVSSTLDRREFEDPTVSRIGNRLYRNTQGVFEDVSGLTGITGITDGGWGWGACFLDFENDGDLDIYHTNGWTDLDFSTDRSRAFVNLGDGTFEEQGIALGLEDREQGRGVICADFDNDGDVDIFLLHDRCTLWRNNSEDNNYLGIRLIGVPPNTQALGTRIILQAGDVMQIREVTGGNNYVSQNPTWQTFGLGQATSADLTIEWPDGNETVVLDVGHSQIVTYQHPDAE